MIAGSSIALVVTGGIAAYKAADLASRLVQAGATVDVIMTEGACRFVQPLTFNALTRRPVLTDPWQEWTPSAAGHVTLAGRIEALVVAPATADAIARLAHGRADDLLGMVALSTTAPLLIAPAMEHHMWNHPATRANVSILRERGATIVGPETGRLASGAEGVGRLASPDAIIGALRRALGAAGPLAGTKIVVTAGGTHEAIDPVRFIGNRSTGQMGYAIAVALAERGSDVTLISGPTGLPAPAGVNLVRVESAGDMLDAVRSSCTDAQALVMAAAVADFRPALPSGQKIKKQPGQDTLELTLVRNPDIIATIDQPGLLKIGFAAETEDLLANAGRKLRAKGLAMIIGNDAVATIGSPDSQATILLPGEPPRPLPLLPKDALASVIADEIVALIGPVA
jgi:phosphopantothenoylcysteine decarboxylase / phosphopantothenate---cysteine ligase